MEVSQPFLDEIVRRLTNDLRTTWPGVTIGAVALALDPSVAEVTISEVGASWGGVQVELWSGLEEAIDAVTGQVCDNAWPDERTDPWPACPEHGDHSLEPRLQRGLAVWGCAESVAIRIGALGGHDPDETLPQAYWRHHQLFTSERRADRLAADDWFWAWQAVADRVHDRGTEALPLLVLLADAAPDDDAVGSLGAGPIEDLVGDETLDEIEAMASRHPRFRLALRSVWHDLSEAGDARFRRLLG